MVTMRSGVQEALKLACCNLLFMSIKKFLGYQRAGEAD